MTGHIRNRKDSNTWQIVIEKGEDASGKRQREYKTFHGKKSDAQKELAKILTAYNTGTYIEPSKLTVRMLAEQWLQAYGLPRLAINTIRGYTVNLEKHTYPYIGHILVQKLCPVDIQHMYAELGKKGLSPRSIRYVHTTLKELLQYAYKMRITSANVAEFVSLPKSSKYRASVYDDNEIAELLRCAQGTDLEIPLMIDLETGLRRGELLALQWKDIDWSAGTANICRNLVCFKGEYHFGDPKTESGYRRLLLSKPLLAKLKQHHARQAEIKLQLGSTYKDHDLICCKNDGSPYNTGSFSHKFQRFLVSNGLKSIRLHDIRHTNATQMLKKGVQPKIASERLGHSSITITLDTYSHVSPDMQQGAVDKLSGSMYSA